jgi:hypothetical protein
MIMVKSIKPITKSKGNMPDSAKTRRPEINNGNHLPTGESSQSLSGKIIDKLDGNQILGVANAAVELAKNYYAYGAEKERTDQTRINAHVRIREIDMEERKNELGFKIEMESLDVEKIKNDQNHNESMKTLSIKEINSMAKNNQIEEAMALLKNGAITADAFNEILRTYNGHTDFSDNER